MSLLSNEFLHNSSQYPVRLEEVKAAWKEMNALLSIFQEETKKVRTLLREGKHIGSILIHNNQVCYAQAVWKKAILIHRMSYTFNLVEEGGAVPC